MAHSNYHRNPILSVEDLTEEDWIFIKEFAKNGGRSTCYRIAYKEFNLTSTQVHNFAKGLVENKVIKEQIELCQIEMMKEREEAEAKADKKIKANDVTQKHLIERALKNLEKAERDENHAAIARYIDLLSKLSNSYKPADVNENKKEINVTYGGWKPAMGLPVKPIQKAIEKKPAEEEEIKNNSEDQLTDVEPLNENE